MRLKKLLLYAALLLILINTVSCNTSELTKRPEIKIGLLHIEDNLPFFAAQKDNLFADCSANIKLVSFNSARERDIALQANEIQGALADLIAVGLLKKGGVPIMVVSLGLGSTPQEGRFVILSSPQSQLYQSQDLINVPIGVSYNTIIQYSAEMMLTEAGLTKEEIALKNIPDLNLRFEALLHGQELKAALLPDPLAALAQASGAHVVIDDTTLPLNISQTYIVFHEDTLQNHPSDVKKILTAYQKAGQSLNEHPGKYHDLIIEKARIPCSLQNSYKLSTFSPLQLPDQAMIDRVMSWMKSSGLIDRAYKYRELVTPGFLP